MEIIAVIGSQALYLFFAWLASAIIAALFAGEKGHGERIGLASGLILAPLGTLIWLLVPAKNASDWTVKGPSKAALAAVALCLVLGVGGLVWSIIQIVGDDANVGHLILAVLALLFIVGAVLAMATAPKRRGQAAPAGAVTS